MRILDVAIIGAGNIAGGYDINKISNDHGVYTHAAAYLAHGGYNLISVFDAEIDKAVNFKKNWNVKKVIENEHELYDSFYDVVSICTHADSHYYYAEKLISNRSCRTIFLEKPLSKEYVEIQEIINLSRKNGINIVVNFQRRFEKKHQQIRDICENNPKNVLSVNCYYTKGLYHIGVTTIDTLVFLFGFPQEVQAFNRIYNNEINEFSYEFILFYKYFSITVKTIDVDRDVYNYHIFEIDIFFKDKRVVIIDNSRHIRTVPVTGYAYSGVKVLNEQLSTFEDTQYTTSMINAAEYVYNVTTESALHNTNTPTMSYNNLKIIKAVEHSFNANGIRVPMEPTLWKK